MRSRAAIGRLADPLVGLVLYIPRVRRLADLSWGDLGATYARGLAVTVAAVAPAVLAIAVAGTLILSLQATVAAVAAGGIAWLVTLRILGHPIYGELARQVARIKGS